MGICDVKVQPLALKDIFTTFGPGSSGEKATSMIWHIFKKDLRLMWLLVAAVLLRRA